VVGAAGELVAVVEGASVAADDGGELARLAHGIGSHGKNRGFDNRFGSQRHGQSQIPHDPREG
jgi:hypothetical protein